MTASNPQGKGLVPILDAWHATQPAQVRAKPAHHILADYFTSLLVLSAEFQFKPCPGNNYYLYWCNPTWKLSLIAPEEWGERAPGPCIGRCVLHADMTWAITPNDTLGEHQELLTALQQFHQGFSTMLETDAPLEQGLPYFVAKLPYYRLLLSTGLASSLAKSIALSSLQGTKSKHWLNRLEGTSAPLLEQLQC